VGFDGGSSGKLAEGVSFLFYCFVLWCTGAQTYLSFLVVPARDVVGVLPHAVVPSPLVEGCRRLPGCHVHTHSPQSGILTFFLTDLI
jgi:hypothetical protein